MHPKSSGKKSSRSWNIGATGGVVYAGGYALSPESLYITSSKCDGPDAARKGHPSTAALASVPRKDTADVETVAVEWKNESNCWAKTKRNKPRRTGRMVREWGKLLVATEDVKNKMVGARARNGKRKSGSHT